MRILLIHDESKYFGGAERVLGYFLEGSRGTNDEFAVACVGGSRVAGLIPPGTLVIQLQENTGFSPRRLWGQARAILAARKGFPFDLAHGWSARDWELAALAGWLARRPALGTLHHHPAARFISPARRRLTGWSARLGLARIVCVSEAVRRACLSARYAAKRLIVVRNGLPLIPGGFAPRPSATFRLGFLGAFGPAKGLRDLLLMLDELSRLTSLPWTLEVVGGAQDAESRRYIAEIQAGFSQRTWWDRVKWPGWADRPLEFLRSLDVLIFPSTEFDAFPTVLLEAGSVGVPVLASRVGGVEEIVQEETTGWLYPPGDVREAARHLAGLMAAPAVAKAAGRRAEAHIRSEFTIGKMAEEYRQVYSSLRPS